MREGGRGAKTKHLSCSRVITRQLKALKYADKYWEKKQGILCLAEA